MPRDVDGKGRLIARGDARPPPDPGSLHMRDARGQRVAFPLPYREAAGWIQRILRRARAPIHPDDICASQEIAANLPGHDIGGFIQFGPDLKRSPPLSTRMTP